jgi:hypothetical protein
MKETLADFKKMKDSMWNEHVKFHSMWKEISKYVRIDAEVINEILSGRGKDKSGLIFDSTAIWANNMLASALIAYMISPNERWFSLAAVGHDLNQLPQAWQEWIEQAENAIYNNYANPYSNFNSSMHESTLDETSIGTSVVYQMWDEELKNLRFEASSIMSCMVADNASGMVDTVVRSQYRTLKQIFEEYEDSMKAFDDTKPDCISNFRERFLKNPFEEVEVFHFILPKALMEDSKGMREYPSYWIILDHGILLKKSGFDNFPYTVSRWTKLTNENYGRGPAWNCINTVRLINSMKKTLLRYSQKQVDPPLQVHSDSVVLPFTTNPGDTIFVEDGYNGIVPLETKGNPMISIEMLRDERDFISKSFYIDWLIQGQTRTEKTAYEIQDKRNEQFLLLAPVLARIASEKLGRMIQRSVKLLIDKKVIPKIPEVDDGQGNKVYISPMYISAAQRAQQYLRVLNSNQWVQQLTQMAQIKPEVVDAVNFDAWVKELSKYLNVSNIIVNDDRTIAQVRQQRAQQQQEMMEQQQEMMQAQQAETMTKAQKNMQQ